MKWQTNKMRFETIIEVNPKTYFKKDIKSY